MGWSGRPQPGWQSRTGRLVAFWHRQDFGNLLAILLPERASHSCWGPRRHGHMTIAVVPSFCLARPNKINEENLLSGWYASTCRFLTRPHPDFLCQTGIDHTRPDPTDPSIPLSVAMATELQASFPLHLRLLLLIKPFILFVWCGPIIFTPHFTVLFYE